MERGKKQTRRTALLCRNQQSTPLDIQSNSSSRDPIVNFKSRNKQAPYPSSRPSEQVFWYNPEEPSHRSRIPHFPGQVRIVRFRPTTRTNFFLGTPFFGTFALQYVYTLIYLMQRISYEVVSFISDVLGNNYWCVQDYSSSCTGLGMTK